MCDVRVYSVSGLCKSGGECKSVCVRVSPCEGSKLS